MIVYSKEQAWIEVNKIFPTDYDKDEVASKNIGYPIYRHHELSYYNYICDLGDRLEVNFEDGRIKNILIKEPESEGMEVEIILKDGHKVTYKKEENATVNFVNNGHIKFYNVVIKRANQVDWITSYRIEQVESITIRN